MATRKPRVPRTLEALVAFAERADLTPAELERVRLGAMLLVADELRQLRAAIGEHTITTLRTLDVVVKQHATLLLAATEGT